MLKIKSTRFLLLTAVAIPFPAVAQTTPSASSETQVPAASASNSGEQSFGLEEIVVTAQRRGENLQSVPISISAVTSSMADAMGIKGTQDIVIAAPAVNFGTTASGANVQIRGVGASGSATDETANAIYIDGVYQSAAPALALPLNNIERIEVAKGPQGTLFGRNSTGGVIQIITRDPPTEPTLDASFGYANYDTVEAQAYVGSGLTDDLAGDIALYYSNQNDGWGKNLATGGDAYKGRSFSGRSKLRWSPGDRANITLAASHVDMMPLASQGGNIFPGQLTRSAGGVPGSTYPGFYNLDHDSSDEKRVRQNQFSGKIEHDLDWAQLVNIASYSKTKFDFNWDNDSGRAFIAYYDIFNSVRAITEEFQLLSPNSSPIKWAVGFFYLNNVNSLDPLVVRGLSQGSPTATTQIVAKSTTDSYALYGQATAPIFSNTNLTVGLRYTIDDRSFDATITTPTGAMISVNDKAKDEKLTWRLSIDHELSPDLRAYLSYNRGYKGGFYNTTSPTQPDIKPETIDAYELGFKSQLLDNHLRFNVAAFYYDFKGIQVRTGTPSGGVAILNAASSHLKGFDIDLLANPSRNFTVQGALSYLDATYKEFQNAPFFTPNPAGGLIQTFADASGNDIVSAPKWVASLGGDYKIPIGSGTIGLSSTVYYNSGYYMDVQNRLKQGDYVLLNMGLSWATASEALEVRIWGRNVTGTRYRGTVASSALSDVYYPGAPRTYGVTVRTRF